MLVFRHGCAEKLLVSVFLQVQICSVFSCSVADGIPSFTSMPALALSLWDSEEYGRHPSGKCVLSRRLLCLVAACGADSGAHVGQPVLCCRNIWCDTNYVCLMLLCLIGADLTQRAWNSFFFFKWFILFSDVFSKHSDASHSSL